MCKTPASRKRMVSLSHVAEVESKWEQSERWEETLEDVGQQVLWLWEGMAGEESFVFHARASHTRLLPCCVGDVLLNAHSHSFSHQTLLTRFMIQVVHSCRGERTSPSLPGVLFINDENLHFKIQPLVGRTSPY